MNELIKIQEKYTKLIEGDTFDFNKFNQYAIVHHSNSIENSTLTKEETYLLLDEGLTPNNKPLEHTLMALDHLKALKYVLSIAENKTPLSSDIIKKTSSLVMRSTGSIISSIGGDFDSSKGEFRKVSVRAGTSVFMDFKKIPDRISLIVNDINNKIKEPKGFVKTNELAFDSHFQMVSIHPFADGNGRLSRLLMNYVQHYHNQPLTIVYSENKQDYFKALQNSRENKDVSIFRRFMFLQTKKFLLLQIKELSKKSIIKKSKGISFLF